MFRPVASIGRDLCVVNWDRDGTASQRGTPIEPVQHQVYDGIARLHNILAREIMGCSGELNDRW